MSLNSQPANVTNRPASLSRSQDTAPSLSSNVSGNPTSISIPSTFEFTKRKRWADLLIHELSEAIIFVLSNECKVLFCSRAVSELLGWRDTELIDKDLVDLVNGKHVYCAQSCHTCRLICHSFFQAKTSMLSACRLNNHCARAWKCCLMFGSSIKASIPPLPRRFSSKSRVTLTTSMTNNTRGAFSQWQNHIRVGTQQCK
jgi:hypothetical protein